MNNRDIVRAWKDPDVEDRSDHPAGAIDLPSQAGAGITVTVPITITVTQAASCWPGCTATVHKGTCAVASYGCCGETIVL